MRRLVPLALCVLLLAGCGGYADTVVPEPESTSGAPAAPVTTEPCKDDGSQRESYDPAGGSLDGPAVQRIRERGKLVAGVAADTYLLGARNAKTGVIEGFDIDMVDAIAAKIFGTAKGHVELRVITAANRIPFLQDGTIDIVSRNMTVNCTRWQQIAFSEIYYDAGQKVLVGTDSGIDSIEDLAGKRICAPAGTTSIDNIQKIQPDAIPVTSTDNSACMILFQNGEADGVSTDDTVLAGLAAQDPYATVLKTDFLTSEPYGIGVNSDDVDLVRLINQTLEDMRADGRWQKSYDKWLYEPLAEVPGVQPEPAYGRR
jgi:polar amino acid transport system substrate-binding protein